MKKSHAGTATKSGSFMVLCGAQGHKGRSLDGMETIEGFAYMMATSPDKCCEFCKKEMLRLRPNMVKNAARDPQKFFDKRIMGEKADA